jgi:hypothetical protein
VSTVERKRGRLYSLPGARVLSDGHVLYWWAEIIAILIFYFVYSAIRNVHGGISITGQIDCVTMSSQLPDHVCAHAHQIMTAEHWLGIFHEETIQNWALHARPLIIAANYFYGSFHFVVTIGAGIFLFRKWSDDYPRFRNSLGISTAVALIGFTFYPLAPPRMFPASFTDTLLKDPAIWTFSSGAAAKVSNQFAAMPSVHICWALWCAVALVPRLKRPWAKVLAAVYPLITLVVIVITANHYFLDAAGGVAIFLIGWFVSGWLTRAGRSASDGAPLDATTQ